MAPTKKTTTSTADRLRARWAKQGGGPELEARLRAAKEELARREKCAMAKARGVTLPDTLHEPVADPTTTTFTTSHHHHHHRAVVADDDVLQPWRRRPDDAGIKGGTMAATARSSDAVDSAAAAAATTTTDAADHPAAVTQTAGDSRSPHHPHHPSSTLPNRSSPSTQQRHHQHHQHQQRQRASPISVEAVMEEARAAVAREVMAAVANGDPPPSTNGPNDAADDADEDDEELAALEAGCVEAYKKPRVVLPPQKQGVLRVQSSPSELSRLFHSAQVEEWHRRVQVDSSRFTHELERRTVSNS